MTHMLCSLAGGKVCVALEVSTLANAYVFDSAIFVGRILFGRDLKLSARGHEGPFGGYASRAPSSDRFGGGHGDDMASGVGAE